MNPDPSKLRQQQESTEQAEELQGQESSRSGQQFGSVEEIIRFDATQSPPPQVIAERLKESIAQEPAPIRSWWQRLFRSRS
jgi:hypothetical protein